MSLGRKSSKDVPELSGFLDRDTELKGEITFKDTLRIDGKFKGSIRLGRHLVIGESADVDADIEVARLTVNGRLRGQAKATERLELNPTARVQSRLTAKVLVVEEGALFEGECSMSLGPREVKQEPLKEPLKKAAAD